MARAQMENELLAKLAKGVLDGQVGDDLVTSGGSIVWKAIKDGVPAMFKQGPSKRFFNGHENETIKGVLHILQRWATDSEKLEFLQKFGWLMKDETARAYSAMFKEAKGGR